MAYVLRIRHVCFSVAIVLVLLLQVGIAWGQVSIGMLVRGRLLRPCRLEHSGQACWKG